jgi:hypothetical protein
MKCYSIFWPVTWPAGSLAAPATWLFARDGDTGMFARTSPIGPGRQEISPGPQSSDPPGSGGQRLVVISALALA